MQLPQALLDSLENIEGFARDRFLKVHEAGEQVTSIRINPLKWSSPKDLEISGKVPWTEYGYYLDKRPSFTFDPHFHAGCYYVQEASSMFLEQALKQTISLQDDLYILDLSAAPGGKSTHLQSLFSGNSLLVSNEVIKTRANTLKQNIIKWGATNVVVTNNDPRHFASLQGFFDVIVVDAPCSGSGLFRKDPEAIGEWSRENVMLCSGRQQRILADVLPALKENGVLIYSTCSYSKEEDEDIMDWLAGEMDMLNLSLEIDTEWNIVKTISSSSKSEGYRFYPDKLKGEGFFLACFKKRSGSENKKLKLPKAEKATAKERAIVTDWVKMDGLELLKHKDQFFAFPSALMEALPVLQSKLYIQYAGLGIGEIIRDKFIPDHALAMSGLVKENVPKVDLLYEDAIRYLQKQELGRLPEGKGWQLACYKGVNLGWMNVLTGRINNYYPKDLRILKGFNDSSFEK